MLWKEVTPPSLGHAMKNIRDEKLIEANVRDGCKTCRGVLFSAGIELSTGSIKATCANVMCEAHRVQRYLSRNRNIHHWPSEPKGNSRKRKPLDKRVEVPFERRDHVYSRDGGVCVHCGAVLYEDQEVAGHLGEFGSVVAPTQMQLLPMPAATPVPQFGVRTAACASRPSRTRLPHEIDHIIPRWITVALADRGMLTERQLELAGEIAVVLSCPGCNNGRQLPRDPVLSPVCDVHVTQMLRLFANRILIDGDVEPIEDSREFLNVLQRVRDILVGEIAFERPASATG